MRSWTRSLIRVSGRLYPLVLNSLRIELAVDQFLETSLLDLHFPLFPFGGGGTRSRTPPLLDQRPDLQDLERLDIVLRNDLVVDDRRDAIE